MHPTANFIKPFTASLDSQQGGNDNEEIEDTIQIGSSIKYFHRGVSKGQSYKILRISYHKKSYLIGTVMVEPLQYSTVRASKGGDWTSHNQ